MLTITGELGRFEELFSEVVYPVWPLWAAGAIAIALATGYLAYRRAWHRVAIRHPLISAVGAVLILAATVPAGYYMISPLFERSLACEASPLAGTGAGSEECQDEAVTATITPDPTLPPTSPEPGEAPTPEPAFEPRVTHQGEFRGADDFHFGRGAALLIETAPGQYVLRFEDFSVRNGPDLYVYLSDDPESYGDSTLELGTLKATDGAFNYDVPAGTDISRFKSAVVWCKQFSVLFAVASLMPA